MPKYQEFPSVDRAQNVCRSLRYYLAGREEEERGKGLTWEIIVEEKQW
jgi:hypothetical protein